MGIALQVAVPAGDASACRRPPCGLLPLAGAAGLPFGLALAAANRPLGGGLGRGLAMGGWPPLLLAAFAAKTQQERIEQFYAIQSHHTQFKTNLSHKSLGSDTTVGKPQWVYHMRRSYISVFQIRMEKMKEVKRPPL
ncbi:hypothetical protein BHM03_00056159 [Ensete ventricosum]|nr:hypothetical protein BHM03_00056159 [Ensete ventricosum]